MKGRADGLSKLIMVTFISKAVREKKTKTEFPGSPVRAELSLLNGFNSVSGN